MATGTLYEILGVEPRTTAAGIEAAVERARSRGVDLELLDVVRATLLDPASRAAYDRLLGLDPALDRERIAEAREAESSSRAAEERLRRQSAWAELSFVMHVTLAITLLALWVLGVRAALPRVEPPLGWLADQLQVSGGATTLAAIVLGLPLLLGSFLLVNLYERSTGRATRALLLMVLITGVIGLILRDFAVEGGSMFAGASAVGVGIALLLLGATLVRAIAVADLGALTRPGRRSPPGSR